jgi:hypothetical protein
MTHNGLNRRNLMIGSLAACSALTTGAAIGLVGFPAHAQQPKKGEPVFKPVRPKDWEGDPESWANLPIGIRNIPIYNKSVVPLQSLYVIARNDFRDMDYYKVRDIFKEHSRGLTTGSVDGRYKFEEPGYYYVGCELMMHPRMGGLFELHHDTELQSRNLALWYFKQGCEAYFRTWRYKVQDMSKEVEVYFINAILEAAGRPVSEADPIKAMAIPQDQLTKSIMDGVKKRDMSQKRTASWAVTWLRNHCTYTGDIPRRDYLKPIELEIRSFTGRIRSEEAGPYYHDPKIGL